jgi:hypothetical protein
MTRYDMLIVDDPFSGEGPYIGDPWAPANDAIPEDEMLLAEGLARCGGVASLDSADHLGWVECALYPYDGDPGNVHSSLRNDAWCGAYDVQIPHLGGVREKRGPAYAAGAALYQALCEDAS